MEVGGVYIVWAEGEYVGLVYGIWYMIYGIYGI